MQDYVNCSIITLSNDDFTINNVALFPNPIENDLNIITEKNIQKIEIYNVIGQLQFKKDIFSNECKLDLSFLNGGTYFLKLHVDGTVINKKIIKK